MKKADRKALCILLSERTGVRWRDADGFYGFSLGIQAKLGDEEITVENDPYITLNGHYLGEAEGRGWKERAVSLVVAELQVRKLLPAARAATKEQP